MVAADRARSPLRHPFHEVLALSQSEAADVQGVLLGGYGGGWITADTLATLPLTEPAARRAGSTLGPGIVVVLPSHLCPLAEVARVVRYMQLEGGGQCGPCVHGLAALADGLQALAFGTAGSGPTADGLLQLCALVEGRGACRHPDGVARLVRSAAHVFAREIAVHGRSGPCPRTGAAPFLPTPRLHRAPSVPHEGPLGIVRPLTSGRR